MCINQDTIKTLMALSNFNNPRQVYLQRDDLQRYGWSVREPEGQVRLGPLLGPQGGRGRSR